MAKDCLCLPSQPQTALGGTRLPSPGSTVPKPGQELEFSARPRGRQTAKLPAPRPALTDGGLSQHWADTQAPVAQTPVAACTVAISEPGPVTRNRPCGLCICETWGRPSLSSVWGAEGLSPQPCSQSAEAQLCPGPGLEDRTVHLLQPQDRPAARARSLVFQHTILPAGMQVRAGHGDCVGPCGCDSMTSLTESRERW